jgi:hypothetical protein
MSLFYSRLVALLNDSTDTTRAYRANIRKQLQYCNDCINAAFSDPGTIDLEGTIRLVTRMQLHPTHQAMAVNGMRQLIKAIRKAIRSNEWPEGMTSDQKMGSNILCAWYLHSRSKPLRVTDGWLMILLRKFMIYALLHFAYTPTASPGDEQPALYTEEQADNLPFAVVQQDLEIDRVLDEIENDMDLAVDVDDSDGGGDDNDQQVPDSPEPDSSGICAPRRPSIIRRVHSGRVRSHSRRRISRLSRETAVIVVTALDGTELARKVVPYPKGASVDVCVN